MTFPSPFPDHKLSSFTALEELTSTLKKAEKAILRDTCCKRNHEGYCDTPPTDEIQNLSSQHSNIQQTPGSRHFHNVISRVHVISISLSHLCKYWVKHPVSLWSAISSYWSGFKICFSKKEIFVLLLSSVRKSKLSNGSRSKTTFFFFFLTLWDRELGDLSIVLFKFLFRKQTYMVWMQEKNRPVLRVLEFHLDLNLLPSV